jgi:hypothetical protein
MDELHLAGGRCRNPVNERDLNGSTPKGIGNGGQGAGAVGEGRGEGCRQGGQRSPSIVPEQSGAPVAGLDSRNGAVQWNERLEALPGGGGHLRAVTEVTALHPPGPRGVPSGEQTMQRL